MSIVDTGKIKKVNQIRITNKKLLNYQGRQELEKKAKIYHRSINNYPNEINNVYILII